MASSHWHYNAFSGYYPPPPPHTFLFSTQHYLAAGTTEEEDKKENTQSEKNLIYVINPSSSCISVYEFQLFQAPNQSC